MATMMISSWLTCGWWQGHKHQTAVFFTIYVLLNSPWFRASYQESDTFLLLTALLLSCFFFFLPRSPHFCAIIAMYKRTLAVVHGDSVDWLKTPCSWSSYYTLYTTRKYICSWIQNHTLSNPLLVFLFFFCSELLSASSSSGTQVWYIIHLF